MICKVSTVGYILGPAAIRRCKCIVRGNHVYMLIIFVNIVLCGDLHSATSVLTFRALSVFDYHLSMLRYFRCFIGAV